MLYLLVSLDKLNSLSLIFSICKMEMTVQLMSCYED